MTLTAALLEVETKKKKKIKKKKGVGARPEEGKPIIQVDIEKLLPEDLLVEILCRLPLKYLMRYKRVCRSWNSLVSNVCAPIISSTAASVPSGIVYRITAEWFTGLLRGIAYACYPLGCSNDGAWGFTQSYKKVLPFDYCPKDLLDICHGLLLFIQPELPQYYVCNPKTKQCVALPRSASHSQPFPAGLAYDPRTSSHYKVVRFIYTDAHSASNPPSLDIFSSETGKWVRRKMPVEPPVALGFPWARRVIYSNGVFYRLSLSKHLLRFDLNASAAQAIDLPMRDETDCLGFIGISGGRLYYANKDRSRSKLLIYLFQGQLKHNYSWKLSHSISLEDMLTKHPDAQELFLQRHSDAFKVYGIHPSEDIIFIGSEKFLMSYDLQSKRLTKFVKPIVGKEMDRDQCSVFVYSPCFQVLKNFGECAVEFSESSSMAIHIGDATSRLTPEDQENVRIEEAGTPLFWDRIFD